MLKNQRGPVLQLTYLRYCLSGVITSGPDCSKRRNDVQKTCILSHCVQYGYRLANEAENTMIYVGVQFWASAERCYTYPILCVRAQQPILVPRVNPYPIMDSFLRLLQAKLSGSCGGGFNMPLRKPSFPSAAVRWTAADAQQVFCN